MNSKARLRSSPYWLITGCETPRMEVLTIDFPGITRFPDGQKALPVFSFREDAEEFLELLPKDKFQGRFSVTPVGGGWWIRHTTRTELFSLLCGACGSVGRILLDPLPEIDPRLSAELVGVSREGFVDCLLGRGRSWFDRGHRANPKRRSVKIR